VESLQAGRKFTDRIESQQLKHPAQTDSILLAITTVDPVAKYLTRVFSLESTRKSPEIRKNGSPASNVTLWIAEATNVKPETRRRLVGRQIFRRALQPANANSSRPESLEPASNVKLASLKQKWKQ
jgi:hypothetical protein